MEGRGYTRIWPILLAGTSDDDLEITEPVSIGAKKNYTISTKLGTDLQLTKIYYLLSTYNNILLF